MKKNILIKTKIITLEQIVNFYLINIFWIFVLAVCFLINNHFISQIHFLLTNNICLFDQCNEVFLLIYNKTLTIDIFIKFIFLIQFILLFLKTNSKINICFSNLSICFENIIGICFILSPIWINPLIIDFYNNYDLYIYFNYLATQYNIILLYCLFYLTPEVFILIILFIFVLVMIIYLSLSFYKYTVILYWNSIKNIPVALEKHKIVDIDKIV